MIKNMIGDGRINMTETTLVYIEQDEKYLMLYRNKKKDDPNAGKWLGVGGHFFEGETPEECAKREAFEETGLKLNSVKERGLVTFISDEFSERMFLFTSDDFEGAISACNEGELKWIPKDEILSLNLWEGDRVFLEKLFTDSDYFEMTLVYKGDKLVEVRTD